MIVPSPRTPATDRRAGFSLIEVVAVMLIIALVASLAVTTMPGTGRGRLKALTLETAALLRRERLGAVMTGRERQVSVDGEQRVLIGDGGDVVAVPRDVVLDILRDGEAMRLSVHAVDRMMTLSRPRGV